MVRNSMKSSARATCSNKARDCSGRPSEKKNSSPTCWRILSSSSVAVWRTRSAVTVWPSASLTPLWTHCQTWEREISAVAASSIRLKMGAAPWPRSQEEMYWMPTLTLLRSPSSVAWPGVAGMLSSSPWPTRTSSRWRPIWLGRSPSTSSNTPIATGTRSGCATQVPSKPSPASRSLSSRTFVSAVSLTSGSRRLGMNAAIPPDCVCAAPVAGLDEQLRVGTHERHAHRHERAVREYVLRTVAELLDDREHVVPAAGIEPGGVLSQLVEDLVHLERSQDRLDEDGGADRPARNSQVVLREHEDVVPQPRFEVRLELGQVEVRARACIELALTAVEEV